MPTDPGLPLGSLLALLTLGGKMVAITKADTDLSLPIRGLWVGTAGDVAVMGADDSAAVTLKNVPSGTFLTGNFKRVMSTNTTASDFVGFI